jgi:hypothetical protein
MVCIHSIMLDALTEKYRYRPMEHHVLATGMKYEGQISKKSDTGRTRTYAGEPK